jgi:radical SAM superfamily enzyme YgiQ (UPF0313 family)
MPLDLLVVAGGIDIKKCDFEILDGTQLGLDEISRRINPQAFCVGFTYSALSAGSLQTLAIQASENGSFVIVGGQPARAAAPSLVRESFIDAVCVGDGQPVMAAISAQASLGKIDPSRLPNVIYEVDGTLKTSATKSEDVWGQIMPSRSVGGLSPKDYFACYPSKNTLNNMRGARASNLFSKRGCPFICSFCARQDKEVRLRDPEIVADEIVMLVHEHGVDYILDTSDTWVDDDWALTFATAKEARGISDLKMMVFADSRHISDSVSAAFRTCGVDSVLLGIESGSERILRRNRKTTTRHAIISAVESLVNAGIRVSCSFVLGLLDEDDDSLAETVDLAGKLCRMDGVLTYSNVIIPLMGTHLWQEAFQKQENLPTYLTRAVSYDLAAVRQSYIESATRVTGGMQGLESACDKILEASGLAISTERLRILHCAAR